MLYLLGVFGGFLLGLVYKYLTPPRKGLSTFSDQRSTMDAFDIACMVTVFTLSLGACFIIIYFGS